MNRQLFHSVREREATDMGWLDLEGGEWLMPVLKPKVVEAMNRHLQPNEQYLSLGMWQTVTAKTVMLKGDSIDTTERQGYILGLTEENLYVAKNDGFWGARAGRTWSRPLSTISEWNFIRHTNKKGEPLGYEFIFAAVQGLEGGNFRSSTKYSEPFKENFEIVMARYTSLTASVDVAGQLSAMHQLWTEGVLSDEEYEKSKAIFLGRSPDQQQVAESNLRSLKQLKDSGILSEAEFAAKKWEILSS